MYNRYVRSDDGRYERIPTPEHAEPGPPPPHEDPPPNPPPNPPPPPPHGGPGMGGYQPPPGSGGKKGFLSGILSKLKLEDIDTGDLLLLLILFLLFKDGEDEELLIALGLMLIL